MPKGVGYSGEKDKNRQESEKQHQVPKVTSRDVPGSGGAKKTAQRVEKRKRSNRSALDIARKSMR